MDFRTLVMRGVFALWMGSLALAVQDGERFSAPVRIDFPKVYHCVDHPDHSVVELRIPAEKNTRMDKMVRMLQAKLKVSTVFRVGVTDRKCRPDIKRDAEMLSKGYLILERKRLSLEDFPRGNTHPSHWKIVDRYRVLLVLGRDANTWLGRPITNAHLFPVSPASRGIAFLDGLDRMQWALTFAEVIAEGKGGDTLKEAEKASANFQSFMSELPSKVDRVNEFPPQPVIVPGMTVAVFNGEFVGEEAKVMASAQSGFYEVLLPFYNDLSVSSAMHFIGYPVETYGAYSKGMKLWLPDADHFVEATLLRVYSNGFGTVKYKTAGERTVRLDLFLRSDPKTTPK